MVARGSDAIGRLQRVIHMAPEKSSGMSGEGGIRTRDTTIFSRVLYQLSYLASGCK